MMIKFAKEFYSIWVNEKPAQLAAALAYFAVFSFAPVIFIVITTVELFLSKVDASSIVYDLVNSIFGEQVMTFVKESIVAIPQPSSEQSILISVFSLGALLFAASGIFFQVQFALNRIWLVPITKTNRTVVFIRQQLFSFLIVIGFGFLAIVAILANFLQAWIGAALYQLFGLGGLLSSATWLIPLAMIFITFALFYKILPETDVSWGDVWLGGIVSTLLTVAAVSIAGFFINHTNMSSAIQAAGAFVVLISAFYYVAEIFLVGAVICRVYAHMFGSMRPGDDDSSQKT
jgi:membrane protein